MRKIERVIGIVLDSAGVGALPDAADFGDAGVNTLGHIREAVGKFELPNLRSLGLINILDGVNEAVAGSYGKMAELSCGKDTTVGHWELMGCVKRKPFPVFPEGFPRSLIQEFEKRTEHPVIGNRAASGTEIMDELGAEHMKTGALIVYTSGDSVFQVAAHESVVPLDDLYRYCRIARELCTGDCGVARVIARPFTGEPGQFQRTGNRHDFSILPESETALDMLKRFNIPVTGLGKISDIYAGQGISESIHTSSNPDGMEKLVQIMRRVPRGFIYVNLVDFDSKYGHRRNPEGYYEALCLFDSFLPRLMNCMRNSDALLITADHGCDPTHAGSDHTREYVPVMAWGSYIKNGLNLGERKSFADYGATVLSMLNIFPSRFPGRSFADMLLR